VQDYQQDLTLSVNESKGSSIVQRGVYLITGGLGNVGVLFASHLISRYNAKVILIGRRSISALSEGGDELKRLKYLEGLGEHARYRQVDISCIDQFRELVIETESDLGRINGIIHAAGDLGNRRFELIEDTTPENVFAIFAPKVVGILNLYEVFKDRKPDFVWITSSLSSIVGGLRFSAYSSSNAFMEHFVSSKSKELTNWVCAGLSELAVADRGETGKVSRKRRFLHPETLLAFFEMSLRSTRSPVIYQTIEDLRLRLDEAFAGDKGTGDPDLVKVEKKERPELRSVFAPPATRTEKKMIELLEDFLGIKGLGVEDNFFDLGGDSLKAMGFLIRIKAAFETHLTIKVFFINPTIRQLSLKVDESILLSEKKTRSSKLII